MLFFTFEVIAIVILYLTPTVYALIKEKESYYYFDILERLSNKVVLVAKIVIVIASGVIFFGMINLETKQQALTINAALFSLPLISFNCILEDRSRSFSDTYKKLDKITSVAILLLMGVAIIYTECIK